MKRLLAITIFIWGALQMEAQDFHFSQFYASPLTMNPGNTGAFNGDLRANTLYRMQWFTVTNPYKTYTISLDAPILKNKMKGLDYFSAGINFSNDNQGTSKLKTNAFNGLISFTKFLGGRQKHDITLGYEIGYVIKSATYGGLLFDNQYNYYTGTGDASLPSGEPGAGSIGFLDMSTGLVWNFRTNHLFRSALGFSMHHFTVPNNSIYSASDRLRPKLGVQWNINYKLSETSNTTLEPSIMAAQQGPNVLINGGISVKYVLQEASRYTENFKDKSVRIGAYYRMRDAVYIVFGYQFADYSASLAYDINVSGLTRASRSVGAFELMLAYKGFFGRGKLNRKRDERFIY
jgi:type IX secretion system PorP/SprF family membrane protein